MCARAVDLTTLAEVALALAGPGATPPRVPAADRAEPPDLGAGFDDRFARRALAAEAAHRGP